MAAKNKKIDYMTSDGSLLLFSKDPGKNKINEERSKQIISFLLIEGFLNHCIEYANRMQKPQELVFFNKTEDFWEGYKFACNYWFNFCKKYCKDDYPPKMRKPTKKEIEKYSYSEKIYLFKKFKDGKQLDTYACDYVSEDMLEREKEAINKLIKEDGSNFDSFTYEYNSTVYNKLIGIVEYRGDKIPVYDDDAGQCFFCKLPNGKIVCGGGWNPDPEDEFCYEWDKIKDNIKF